MPSQHPRDWVDFATAIGPLLAVLVAVAVALMQYYLQRQQFKQNLYDKRFGIYEAARAYLIEVMQKDGNTDILAYQRYRAATEPAEFLFGAEVWEHVTRIGKLGLEFRSAQLKYVHYDRILHTILIPPADDDRLYQEALENHPKLIEETAHLTSKVIVELEGGLKAAFSPYLRLHHEKEWPGRLKDTIDLWMQQTDSTLASRYKAE